LQVPLPAGLMVGLASLPLWFSLACRTGFAQEHPVFSPNPPACAKDAADILLGITDVATGIVFETTLCARALGWHGQSIYGDLRVYPHWHNERGCAIAVMSTINNFCGIAGSALTAAFDCFNDNEGCGQTIASLISFLIQIGSSLVIATASCAPPGTGPPYFALKDRPIANFNCYRTIWHIIQRLVKVAKYIDVAIEQCRDNAETISSAEGSPGSAEVLIDSFNDTNSSDDSEMTSSWSSIAAQQQNLIPAQDLDFLVKPVERRLDEMVAGFGDLKGGDPLLTISQKIREHIQAVVSAGPSRRANPSDELPGHVLHV